MKTHSYRVFPPHAFNLVMLVFPSSGTHVYITQIALYNVAGCLSLSIMNDPYLCVYIYTYYIYILFYFNYIIYLSLSNDHNLFNSVCVSINLCIYWSIPFFYLPIYLSTFPILSCSILSYSILSNPILSNPILSNPIQSYLILSNPISSYPILSNPILSISLSLLFYSSIYLSVYLSVCLSIYLSITV